MFARSSRYAPVPEAFHVDELGRERPYKLLRVVPAVPAPRTHRVAERERLDLVANRYFGDPEAFWRLCDANLALRPAELEEVGRRIGVPLPVAT